MQYVVKIILFLAPRLQLRLVLRQQRNSSTANRGQLVCVSKAGQFGKSINDRVNVNDSSHAVMPMMPVKMVFITTF